MKEFKTAIEEILAEDGIEDEEGVPVEEQFIEFTLTGYVPDGEEDDPEVEGGKKPKYKEQTQTLHAYSPTDGQLAFMLAALGRGQTKDQRFAAIVNIMMSTLRDDDQDYFESRLLTRDPLMRIRASQLEEIFEFLAGEWFGRPTQPPSDSAS